MARVTALWHLERKSPIPMSTRQEADTAFPALEESGLERLHTRRGLTPLGKPQRNPEIHVGTGEEP